MSDRMLPFVEELQEIIRSGVECRNDRAQRFRARLSAESYGLWTSVETESDELTNNQGERGSLRRQFIDHTAES